MFFGHRHSDKFWKGHEQIKNMKKNACNHDKGLFSYLKNICLGRVLKSFYEDDPVWNTGAPPPPPPPPGLVVNVTMCQRKLRRNKLTKSLWSACSRCFYYYFLKILFWFNFDCLTWNRDTTHVVHMISVRFQTADVMNVLLISNATNDGMKSTIIFTHTSGKSTKWFTRNVSCDTHMPGALETWCNSVWWACSCHACCARRFHILSFLVNSFADSTDVRV